ncbi:MAG: biotin/lipoyl-binding protein [Bdellovibrionaceae bacterium]|nr:biotin/lipoyl-binding protein [Bdellovibrionales bacterium]MCB9083029.1 biotin/lipoyl-binding protein [Pseudobdellovibrionaceae bacterium]
MSEKKIRRLMIANRGAIVTRIARTCRQMGIITIGVYSEADKESSYLREVDEAFFVGAATASQSYLNQQALLAVAKRAQVDAIHPGYGFLAENAEFAQACLNGGFIWVGPPVEAMRQMGTKKEAKYLVSSLGLPVIPGAELNMDEKSAAQAAKKVGFPLLIKASAGGGGKGMRLVQGPEQFSEAWSGAAREAKQAFGDATLLVEKCFPVAKHIEVQVLADRQGNIVHMGERECSVQRRHQKIIEECPSPVVSSELRRQLGEWSVKIAKAIGYEGVGTVEFLADASSDGELRAEQIYFLEMNTRIQVEHGVTEEVYRVDLVREQIRVAQGESGGWQQDQLVPQGHSIQCRLYAEDPGQNFLPQTGEVKTFFPYRAPGVRWELGLRQGDRVGTDYDPMVAKVITKGANREEARQLMMQTLSYSSLLGLRSNQGFLLAALSQDDFISGQYKTHQAGGEWQNEFTTQPPVRESTVAALLARSVQRRSRKAVWSQLSAGWSNMPNQRQRERVKLNGEEFVIEYWVDEFQQYHIVEGGQERVASILSHPPGRMRLEIFGQQYKVRFVEVGSSTHVHVLGLAPSWIDWQPRVCRAHLMESSALVRPPTSGKVVQVMIKVGDAVKKGDPLVVLESMKMETSIYAERDGLVEEVFVSAGDVVQSHSELLRLDEND